MDFFIRSVALTASTNDDAKQAAEAGALAGAVIWALEQKAGRGRQGRVWHSPPGNLYCSTVLRPAAGVRVYGLYSFVAALAAADAARAFLPEAAIALKWPNDVLVGGKKICGILLEAGADALIVGIGMNVAHVPENPIYPVTSLGAEGAHPPVRGVLDALLAGLGHWAETFEKDGFAPVRQAWLALARRGALRARLPDGGEIHGEFADLDDTGALVLRLPGGETRVLNAGDVFF